MMCAKPGCPHEVRNVPEHLQELATWLCQHCAAPSVRTVAAPKNPKITIAPRVYGHHGRKVKKVG